MKKVLILSNHFATIYKFRRELVEKLVEKGYEVVVSLPKGDDNKEIEALGVRIIETYVDRKSLNPIKDIKLFLDYLKIIKKEKPDIAIGYTIKPNIYGGMASRIRKTPFIANVTGLGSAYYKGGMLKKIVSTLYKVGLKKAKSVFFENVQNAQVMIDDKTITKEQAVVMNGAGVNLERFSFSPMPKDDITKFLFVGRVMEEKGVNELFDAIKKIKSEKIKTEFGFLGWFEEDYSQIIKDLEAKDYIKYYGYQKDVVKFMREAHCIVLPSYHEGMANVLLEGASIGRALIATDIHGCKESIINGVSGFTCKVKDSGDLYDKIKKFTLMSYDDKAKMGQCGRRHMEDVFDKRKVVEMTVEEIER